MRKTSFCLALSIPFFFAMQAEQEKKPLEIISKSIATTFCCVGAAIVPFLVAHKQRLAQRCSISYSLLPFLYTAAKLNGLDHYFLIPTVSKRNLPLALGKLGLSCLHACLGLGHLICPAHHVELINQKIECSYNSYALAHHLISAPVFFSTAYELFRSGMSSLGQKKT